MGRQAVEHQIEIRARCSMSRGAAAAFFASIVIVSLTIAALFTSRGYWPVLPFAGLELTGLGFALGLSMRRGRWREVVRIAEDYVEIECAIPGRSPQTTRFPRHWASVRIRGAPYASHPSRLLIGCCGRWHEIARFLTETDRQRLGERLSALIGATNQTPALERGSTGSERG